MVNTRMSSLAFLLFMPSGSELIAVCKPPNQTLAYMTKRTGVGRKCEYRLPDGKVRFCGKHDIQKMDVERQVFPNPDIPGEIPE
jgi:hypothetical protein